MKVIFNSDDFGMSRGVNYGIIDACLLGPVRSATMMANMPAFLHGVSLLPHAPKLAVGAHLVLTAGKSLGGPYKTITDCDGFFQSQSVLKGRAEAGEIDLGEVERELSLQIEKLLGAGIKLSHLDGHHHIHGSPGISDVCLELARKRGLPMRDFANQGAGQLGFKAPAFYGDFYGESANLAHLEKVLSSLERDTEIMCHPAYVDGFLLDGSTYNVQRARELYVLTDPRLAEMLSKYGHTLASYADWSRA